MALHDGSDLQAVLSSMTTDDLLFLAVSHARSGDLLRAEQYLNAARQRSHDDATVVYWLVRVCVAANRYQSALSHAARYLQDHPSAWPLRFVVATIYEALGDVDRAQLELERIVGAQPAMPLPHYRLAMIYRNRQADQERARLQLGRYLSLAPRGAHAAEARSALREMVDVSAVPRLVPYPPVVELPEAEAP